MKRFLFTAVLALGLAVRGYSQSADSPTWVPVKLFASVSYTQLYDGDQATYQIGYGGGDALISGANDPYGGGGTFSTNTGTARMRLGSVYHLYGSGTASPTATITNVSLSIVAPPGYSVMVNGQAAENVNLSLSSSYNSDPIDVCILGPGQMNARAGVATSLFTGDIYWQVALGGLKNGRSAGSITMSQAGADAWTYVASRANLMYESPSAEVYAYSDSGGLRQIKADQADVDIVGFADGSFELRFYNPSQAQGSTLPYTFTGLPYVAYHVVGTAAGSPQVNTITITKVTHLENGLASGTPLSSSQPDPGKQYVARSAETTLQLASGTWTVSDWTDVGKTALVGGKSTFTAGAGNTTIETRTIETPGADNPDYSITKTYSNSPYPDYLSCVAPGDQALATTFTAYDSSDPNSAWFPESISATNGSSTRFLYSSTDPGVLTEVDTPSSYGTVAKTIYTYSSDPFGMPTRPASITTTIHNSTGDHEVSAASITYSDSNLSTAGYENTGRTVVTSNRVDSIDSSHTLTTSTKFYAENSPDFFASQTYSVTKPDGTMVDYAYEHGTLSGDSFTASTSGGASRVAMITGNNSSGTELTSWGNSQIDPIHLTAWKASALVTIRDTHALVRRTENYVWDGSAWQLVGWTNLSFDAAGLPLSQSSSDGTATSATYKGDLLDTQTSATGLVTTYSTYDVAGRPTEITSDSGPTITLEYKSSGQVTKRTSTSGTESLVDQSAYDTAGRLTSQTPAGMGSTTFSYSYSSSGWSQTQTNPDTGTVTKSFNPDGLPDAITGNAAVEQQYAYQLDTINSETVFAATVTYGGGTARWSKAWTDWLGRTIKTSRPGFTGQSDYVESYTYDSNGHISAPGRLVEMNRTGYAATLYSYGPMGDLTTTALDLDANKEIGLDTADRVTKQDQAITYVNKDYWARRQTDIYPTAGSKSAFTSSVVITRLTGLASNNEVSETKSTDQYGNAVTQKEVVDSVAHSVTVTTTPPAGSANDRVQTTTYIPSGGYKVETTDFDGLAYKAEFDAFGRQTSGTDSRSNQTTYTPVTGTPYIAMVKNGNGDTVQYGYDTMGRCNEVVDGANNVVRTQFTTLGAIEYRWGKGTHPVEFGYNVYGERKSMMTYKDADAWNSDADSWPGANKTGQSTGWTFDEPSGLLQSKTDAAGTVTMDYNVRGQIQDRFLARHVANDLQQPLVKATYSYYGDSANDAKTGELKRIDYNDGLTPSVSYTYQRTGLVKTVSDATGTRTFNYDSTLPDQINSISLDAFYNNRVLTRLYNSDGLLLGRPSGFAIGTPAEPNNDLRQEYYYNGNGRFDHLTSSNLKNANTRTFTYGYDSSAPLVTAVTAGDFSVTRGYDPKRNLLTDASTKWGGGQPVTYASFHCVINANGQRESDTISGTAFQDYYSGTGDSSVYNAYHYDAAGELDQCATYTGTPPSGTQIPGRAWYYFYDGIGNRRAVGPSSTETSSLNDAYDTGDFNEYHSKQAVTLAVLGNAAANASVTSNAGPVNKTARNYAASVVVPSPNANPSNPTVSVTATVPDGQGGYASKGISRNYLLPPEPQSFSYDGDGNMTGDSLWRYTYDAENRLIRMQNLFTTFSAIPFEIDFTYDYLGRRVEKKVYQTETQLQQSAPTLARRYVYDGWNMVEELDGAGAMVRSYTWGLDLGGSLTASGGVGGLLSLTNYSGSTATGYFVGCDPNGNVSVLVNASSGVLAAAYEYTAFGMPLRNECFDSNVADNPFRFSSKFTDLETGLVYYGARYYSSDLGRFINRDPIEETGGLNLYGFCGNDAVNHVDYLGQSWLSRFLKFTRKATRDVLNATTLGTLRAPVNHLYTWGENHQQEMKIAAAIVASIFTYGAASGWAMGAMSTTTAGVTTYSIAGTAISATTAGAIAGVVGGAAAGAVGGTIRTGTVQGALRGAAVGAIMGGISGYYGKAWTLSRVGVTTVGGGLASEVSGGSFRQGALISGGIALVTYGAIKMREYEWDHSAPEDRGRVSDGFNHDGKGLAGGRHHVVYHSDGTITVESTPLPFGGDQGAPIGTLFGHPYFAGSWQDHLLEAFSGVHDFLGHPWGYNAAGYNDAAHSFFGSAIASATGSGAVAEDVSAVMSVVNLFVTAPIAAVSTVGTVSGGLPAVMAQSN